MQEAQFLCSSHLKKQTKESYLEKFCLPFSIITGSASKLYLTANYHLPTEVTTNSIVASSEVEDQNILQTLGKLTPIYLPNIYTYIV